MSYESYCAACTYLGESANSSGKYWCSRKGESRYASDGKCGSFCEAYSRSNSSRSDMLDNSKDHQSGGCYLTTIMCKILELPDHNYYLDTLRGFRDNVMQKNPKYLMDLSTYDVYGPMIAYRLENDPNKKEIATSLFNNYISKAVLAVSEEKNEEAIKIYRAMTLGLADRYNISVNTNNIDVNGVDIKTLGHGKVRTLTK